jgi:hypothetical protein
MKRSIVLLSAACLALGISAQAQTETFKFTPGPNTLGPEGSDYSTPSYVTFSPTAGSFDYPNGIIAATYVVNGPTTGADYVVSWDVNTPDGALDTGSSYFPDNVTQEAAWSLSSISSLDLTLQGASLSANLGVSGIDYEAQLAQDPNLPGKWTAVPDTTNTLALLAGTVIGLLASTQIPRLCPQRVD